MCFLCGVLLGLEQGPKVMSKKRVLNSPTEANSLKRMDAKQTPTSPPQGILSQFFNLTRPGAVPDTASQPQPQQPQQQNSGSYGNMGFIHDCVQ